MVIVIKFFDCFSGIGGFRSGLEQAGGFECVGFCEIDRHAAAAYKAIYNTEKEAYYSDITTIDTAGIPDFDLLVGGLPCQPYSVASANRRGLDDPRGALFFEFARIIREKRPAAFFVENVPFLLSHNSGETFEKILGTFSELGYYVEWMVYNSSAFGLPQSRRRLYIVGYTDAKCAGKIFPVDCGAEKAPKELIGGMQGQRVYDVSGSAVTICACGHSDVRRPCRTLVTASQHPVASAGGWGGKTGLYFIDLNPNPQITEKARCLIARYDSGISNHKGVNSGVFIEGNDPKAISFYDKDGNYRVGRIRKLMPCESWMLQGFSREQFDKAAELGMSDGHLYRLAGNAVSVPVIKAIGKKIRDVIFSGGDDKIA